MYKERKKEKNALKNKSGETTGLITEGFLNLLQLMMTTHAKLWQLAERKTKSTAVRHF